MPQIAFFFTGKEDIVYSQKMRNRNIDQQTAYIFVHLLGRQNTKNVYTGKYGFEHTITTIEYE